MGGKHKTLYRVERLGDVMRIVEYEASISKRGSVTIFHPNGRRSREDAVYGDTGFRATASEAVEWAIKRAEDSVLKAARRLSKAKAHRRNVMKLRCGECPNCLERMLESDSAGPCTRPL